MRRPRTAAVALGLVLALVLAACGGSSSSSGGAASTTNPGKPVRGGTLNYGLEAETAGGWCLAEAQLAISGIQVADTVYDTLTRPNAKGEMVPFLAKSVEHDPAYQKWTITLRNGITFSDGSPLDAQVVKDNLDAYRGKFPLRKPLLFVFVFDNISNVTVTGPMTVEVDTAKPWPALPWFLWGSGRIGIMGEKQLRDTKHCDTDMVGTGPFMKKEWVVNDHFTAVRNPHYWRKDANGVQLPYLDEVVYRPIPTGSQRVQALLTGAINAMHDSNALDIAQQLRPAAKQGKIGLIQSEKYTEVGYSMLNASKPPFDSLTARQAMAYAIDRDKVNTITDAGILTNASGPFAPGNMGYLEDTGYPNYDLAKAKSLVKQYEQECGCAFKFTLSSTPEPDTIKTAQLVQGMAQAAGAKVSLKQVDQSQLISTAIAGDFQAVLWRNHPGGDPDTQYVWWYSKSPVNFGKINDPVIDKDLEQGRVTVDPAEREKIYEDLNREFAKKLWNLWGQWTLWTVSTAPNVHGALADKNPDGSGAFPGLATGHSVAAMWISK